MEPGFPPTFADEEAQHLFYVLKLRARAGNADAQFELAGLYLTCRVGSPSNILSGEPDCKQACIWLRKAAEQGHPEACNSLGVRYNRGQGVQRNPAIATSLFRQAAEAGCVSGQVNLALNLERGNGGQRDVANAIKLYEQAAEKGNATAAYRLGDILLNGLGVDRDLGRAIKALRRSAHADFAPALSLLGYAYAAGDGVDRDLERAWLLLKRAAELGDKKAAENFESIDSKMKRLERESLESRYMEMFNP